jgi:type IV secretory pathway component VirB8
MNSTNDPWIDFTDTSVLIALTLPALVVPLTLFICIPLICLIKLKKKSPFKSEDDEEEVEIEGSRKGLKNF